MQQKRRQDKSRGSRAPQGFVCTGYSTARLKEPRGTSFVNALTGNTFSRVICAAALPSALACRSAKGRCTGRYEAGGRTCRKERLNRWNWAVGVTLENFSLGSPFRRS